MKDIWLNNKKYIILVVIGMVLFKPALVLMNNAPVITFIAVGSSVLGLIYLLLRMVILRNNNE